jgi:hypothetical protein
MDSMDWVLVISGLTLWRKYIYSLTYSMEQSPSWEANGFSAGQEISCLLEGSLLWEWLLTCTFLGCSHLTWLGIVQRWAIHLSSAYTMWVLPLHARLIWQYVGELRAQDDNHDLRTDQEGYLSLTVVCAQLTDSFIMAILLHSTWTAPAYHESSSSACLLNLAMCGWVKVPRYASWPEIIVTFDKSEKRWTVPPHIGTVTTVTRELSIRHLPSMVDASCHCQDLSVHNEIINLCT